MKIKEYLLAPTKEIEYTICLNPIVIENVDDETKERWINVKPKKNDSFDIDKANSPDDYWEHEERILPVDNAALVSFLERIELLMETAQTFSDIDDFVLQLAKEGFIYSCHASCDSLFRRYIIPLFQNWIMYKKRVWEEKIDIKWKKLDWLYIEEQVTLPDSYTVQINNDGNNSFSEKIYCKNLLEALNLQMTLHIVNKPESEVQGFSLGHCEECGVAFIKQHGNQRFCEIHGAAKERVKACKARRKKEMTKHD